MSPTCGTEFHRKRFRRKNIDLRYPRLAFLLTEDVHQKHYSYVLITRLGSQSKRA